MFSLVLLNLFASLFALHASAGGYVGWHMDKTYTLVNERIDPIVNPNAISQHQHKVIGSSRFGASYSYDDYNGASCTSVEVQADKSAYWMPNLYWVENGKFIPLPSGIRFYYFLTKSGPTDIIHPFPKGLRMLVGDPMRKTPNPLLMEFACATDPTTANPVGREDFNFDIACPYGLKTHVKFPPCWDGVNTWKPDMSHMAYPPNGNVRFGSCPLSHRVRIPQMMFEFSYYPERYAPGVPLAGHLAWANGDMTGHGIHGDFVNGWDTDVLAAALNSTDCVGDGPSSSFTNCPIFAAVTDREKASNCRPEKGSLNEGADIDLVPVDALPGCNLPWTTGPKPTCPSTSNPPVGGLAGTMGSTLAVASEAKPFKLPTKLGWNNVACLGTQQAVTGGIAYADSALTVDSCQASCFKQGYKFSAVGQSGSVWNCVCGDALDMSKATMPGACTYKCPGNATQTCGANYMYDVYYAPEGTTMDLKAVVSQAGGEKIGCYSSNTNDGLSSVQTYSYQSASMTNGDCINTCTQRNASWAMTTSGRGCSCGNDFKYGSGAIMPDSYCTVPCAGNSTQMCGDLYRSTLWNVTSARAKVDANWHETGWQGCYQAPGAGQYALSDNYWIVNTMTPKQCIDGCAEMGYSLAGNKLGNGCYCGNQFNGVQQLPEKECYSPCAGNKTTHCGGGTVAIDLYATQDSDRLPANLASKGGAPYVGCFAETSSASPLTEYTYNSNSMTTDTCVQACGSLGYKYGGLNYRATCNCGNTLTRTLQQPQPLKCVTPCAGNSSETCGGAGWTAVYDASGYQEDEDEHANGYVGCYNDATKGMTDYSFSTNSMTIDICRTGCMELDYSLAGIVAGSTCYCGNSYPRTGRLLPDNSCSSTCQGDKTQSCGANNIISLFNTTGAAAVPQKPEGWVACWSDSTTRALASYQYTATPMSSSICRRACAQQGYSIAGTEGGNQCYCGDSLASGGQVPASFCAMPCSGTTTGETCGYSWRLDVYNTTGAVTMAPNGYLGCYNDYQVLATYSYYSTMMTPEICTKSCQARGYALSGVKGGNQCFCGDTAPTKLSAKTSCDSPCTGNSTLSNVCGGGNFVSVTNVKSAGITNVDFPMNPDTTGFVGCFSDNNAARALTYAAYTATTNTNAQCATQCKTLGYKYSGTEQGTQCYCGNKIDPTANAIFPVAAADCGTPCAGGGAGTCGASNRISVYDTSIAAEKSSGGSGDYKGCFAPGTFISSPEWSYGSSATTIDLCRRTCNIRGFSTAGLTTGNNCMCSNKVLYGAQVAEPNCAMACNGNSTQVCGGRANTFVSVYDTRTATPPADKPANYQGCMVDTAAAPLMKEYNYQSAGMTSDLCRRVCAGLGYANYGTEYGKTCYCSATLPTAGLVPDVQCNTACAGIKSEMCGGPYRMSVYNAKYVAPVASVAPSSSAAASSIKPVSSSAKPVASSITVASSIKASASSIKPLSSAAATTSKAAVSSAAATTSRASSVAAVSSVKPPVSSAAATTSKAAVSTAPVSSIRPPASSAAATTSKAAVSSAPASSAAATTSRAASSAAPSVSRATSSLPSQVLVVTTGVTSPVTSPKPASTTPVSSVRPSSAAASSARPSSVAPPASSAKPSTTTAKPSSAAPATSSAASLPPASTDSAYVGCYADNANVIVANNMSCTSLTPMMCKVWCQANNMGYAALTKGTDCACSNDSSRLTKVPESNCAKPCIGDDKQKCGGDAKTYMIFKSTGAVKRDVEEVPVEESQRSYKKRDTKTVIFDGKRQKRRSGKLATE